jgi:hypothetical protein
MTRMLGNIPPLQGLYLHRAAETLAIFGGVSMPWMIFQTMIPIFEIKRKPQFAFRDKNFCDIELRFKIHERQNISGSFAKIVSVFWQESSLICRPEQQL